MEADDFLKRALARINVVMIALMTAGAVASAWWGGWRGGAGFFLGAAASYFYFGWIKQMVDSLAPGAPPPRKRLVVFLLLRYAIFGVSGYVIVKYVGINLPAALAGLFIPVAAILVEIVYELIYVRS